MNSQKLSLTPADFFSSDVTPMLYKTHPRRSPQHSMELESTEMLMTESRWFERGVKEAICLYIRDLNPSLNKDGGRYDLQVVWEIITKKKVKADRSRNGGGWVGETSHYRLTQHPQQYWQDVRTEEADRNQRKLL